MAKLVHVPEEVLRRERRLNGLPQPDQQRWLPLVFWTLLALLFAGATIGYQYFLIMALAMDRNAANVGISASLGLLPALLPLAAWRIVCDRFRLRSLPDVVVAGAWSVWLAVVLGTGVMVWRQTRLRSIPDAWAPAGLLTLGVAGALVLSLLLVAATFLALRARELRRPSPWHWVAAVVAGVGLVAAGAWLVVANTRMTRLGPPDVPDGYPVPSTDALLMAADKAWPTLLCYVALFVLVVDRRRPVGWLGWLFALAWGAGASTMLSIEINTWAGHLLGSGADEGGGANMRTAVYIAPFVEEAAKASVLFLAAALWRDRLVNKLNLVALAGLSAVGFAFTENIIYYLRAISFASGEIGAGDAEDAVNQLARLRGVLTSWGHPMFTVMTGMGLAFGLRNRSRLARILFPLAGFLAAAGLHMTFNLMASTTSDMNQIVRSFTVMGAGVVISLLMFLVTNWIRENRLVRQRLTDYARMGWLPARDADVVGRSWNRVRLALFALLVGPRTWWHTLAFLRSETTLAYLRDDMVRGLVDRAGLAREKELLAVIRHERTRGLSDVKDWRRLPFFWKTYRAPWRRKAVTPAYPGPAGLGGSWPAPTGLPAGAPTGPGGSRYSAVDPSWAPPA